MLVIASSSGIGATQQTFGTSSRKEVERGDCWIAISLAQASGLILAARVGKHTDNLLAALLQSTEGKTNCLKWSTDDWGGYERVLPPEVEHYITKSRTQRLERTNGIVRQQTGRFHRRQNKFGKEWRRTEMTLRLVVSYFNWIWCNSRTRTTAATESGVNVFQLGLAGLCHLPHTSLTHNQHYLCATRKLSDPNLQNAVDESQSRLKQMLTGVALVYDPEAFLAQTPPSADRTWGEWFDAIASWQQQSIQRIRAERKRQRQLAIVSIAITVTAIIIIALNFSSIKFQPLKAESKAEPKEIVTDTDADQAPPPPIGER